MTDTTKRKTWLLPALLLLLVLGGWLTYRAFNTPFTPPSLPTINGYDDLLKAAELLAPRTDFYDEMDESELATVVQQNQPALELVRAALLKECVVTLNWSADRAWLDNVHSPNVMSMKSLARAFAAAARYEGNNGRTESAVRHGLDCIDLAQACSTGGLVIDRMMAGGVHYTALYALREQTDQLSRDDCLRLMRKLQTASLQLEAPEQTLDREAALFRKISGGFQTFMMSGVIRDQRKESLKSMSTSDQQHAMMETLLQTHLALRAYQLDNDQLPVGLTDLVPTYLKQVPTDSFSQQSLIYRPTNQGYQLYSVGANGVDDGGVESTNGSDGDILLEVMGQ